MRQKFVTLILCYIDSTASLQFILMMVSLKNCGAIFSKKVVIFSCTKIKYPNLNETDSHTHSVYANC